MKPQRDRAAGVVVYYREPQTCVFLLVLSKLTKKPLWEFPKGGVQPGESPQQAALRELEEETGLRAGDVRIIPGFEQTESYRFTTGSGSARRLIHKHVTYFLAQAKHREVRVSASEIFEHAWVELPEAFRRVRYAERKRLLQAAAEAAGCPANGTAPPASPKRGN